MAVDLTDLERGIVCGLLLSQGSFGGDGRQPQITLRMHVRHAVLLEWLTARFPRSRLYGPYHHGDRSYYQWMARGRALVEDLLPVLESVVSPELDEPAAARLAEMKANYADSIARIRAREGDAP
ncbi:MAG: hypothetical protein JWM71_895 [Solirubrobacteraceae bacterium]|nr:hypothetical protein [Solirubrobacteraceae bacterium]